MRSRRFIPVAALLAAVVLVQLGTALAGKDFYLTQLTSAAYYVLAIIGLCLLMGYAGQISLGQAGFFAIGGYTTAVITTFNFLPYKSSLVIQALLKTGLAESQADRVSVSPWAALVLAVIIAFLTALVIGIPILKLKGHYLAMATLGFGLIVHRIVLGTRLFGEADGISEIPAFPFFAGLKVCSRPEFRTSNYYIAWALAILGLVILLNLIHSRAGRALRAIHGNEEAARASGVDVTRYKLYIFILSAVFTAVAGVFLTHFNGGIGPTEADVMKSVRYVAIVAVGGMANIWGALVMGVVLNYISLRGYLGSYDDAFFGAILITIMIFAPEGIFTAEKMEKIRSAAARIRARLFNRGQGKSAP